MTFTFDFPLCVLCVMQVLEHKMLRTHGVAQIYLDEEEYGWFTRWTKLRQRSLATNKFFFSTLGKG